MTSTTPKKISSIYKAAQHASIGLEMAIAIAIGWGLGTWLDEKFDSDPWLMITGLILGVAAGFMGIIRVIRQHQRETANATPPNHDDNINHD